MVALGDPSRPQPPLLKDWVDSFLSILKRAPPHADTWRVQLRSARRQSWERLLLDAKGDEQRYARLRDRGPDMTAILKDADARSIRAHGLTTIWPAMQDQGLSTPIAELAEQVPAISSGSRLEPADILPFAAQAMGGSGHPAEIRVERMTVKLTGRAREIADAARTGKQLSEAELGVLRRGLEEWSNNHRPPGPAPVSEAVDRLRKEVLQKVSDAIALDGTAKNLLYAFDTSRKEAPNDDPRAWIFLFTQHMAAVLDLPDGERVLAAGSASGPDPVGDELIDSLSDVERSLLQALLALAAIDPVSRRDRDTIARTAQRGSPECGAPGDVRDALSKLVKRGLASSKEGASGGYWLSAKGQLVAPKLS